MNHSDIAILNIKDSENRFIISLISKNEVINFFQNDGLTKKPEHYKVKKQLKKKMEKTVIKFGDIEIEKQKFHQDKVPLSIKYIYILMK